MNTLLTLIGGCFLAFVAIQLVVGILGLSVGATVAATDTLKKKRENQ